MQFFSVDVAFATPTEAGLKVCKDGKVFVSVFNTGLSATANAGQPYNLTYKNTLLKHVDLIAPATLASAVHITAVPAEDIADDAFGWVQIYGECEAKCDGTTDISAGDFLSVTNAETAFTKEGTALAKDSSAIAIDAYTDTADALKTVFLLGIQHETS